MIASERRFAGCKGLAVTEEMKVTIAAQAALLLLGNEGYYFDRVTAFLIYPDKLILPPAGLRPSAENEGFDERIVLGVAYQVGGITLSWPDVLDGGRTADDGDNVVLHELAHHLDGLDGAMGGSPPGLSAEQQDRFQLAIDREMVQLRRDLAQGLPTVLSPAAAENNAELFAYGTTAFFEQPHELHEQFPRLFGGLMEFYKVDPRRWFKDAELSQGSEEDLDFIPDEDVEPAAELPALETADEHFTRGIESFERADYEAAEADFDRAVKLAPQDQEAVLFRGRARCYLGDTEAALADAERACRLAPDDQEAIALRGICQVALGEIAAGLADLESAAESPSDDLDLHYHLGLARAETGQTAAAIAAFTRLIQLDARDADAWHERSLCHFELGDEAAAERDLEQARLLGWTDDQMEQ